MPPASSRTRRLLATLPIGAALPEDVFAQRHRWLLNITAAHVPVLFAVGIFQQVPALHLGLELLGIVGLLLVASRRQLGPRTRAAAATTALIACSAVLVHLTGGLVESHFHFFVVVALVTVYQQWLPFLLCIGWVVLHHGVLGVLQPQLVFANANAQARPVLWAGIHAVYVLLASLASVLTWRLAERERLRAESVLAAAPQPTYGIDGDGHLRFVNDAFVELVGHDVPLGVHHHEVLHPDVSPCPWCDAAADERREHRIEHTVAALPDGRSVPVEVRTRPAVGSHHLGAVVAFWDISDELEQRRALEELALTDPLTGLANRALLTDRLQLAISGLSRRRGHVGVLFIDLDGFKPLNDAMGHAAGDEVLRSVAARLRDETRAGETVARVGGDEFVVVLTEIEDPANAQQLAERGLAAIGRQLLLEGGEAYISASIGVAITNVPSTRPDRLLSDADVAMYEAKRRGGGQVVAYHVDMRDGPRLAPGLASDLLRALDRDELVLDYQPIWDAASLRLTGVEALVRWQHPELGLLPPGSFVPLAEQTGLIVPLGRWVLEHAVAQLDAWIADPALDAGELTMSVNLSVRQLRDPAFLHHVEGVLESASFAASQLCLEITESLLMGEGDAGRAVLVRLRGLGVRLAIDDFGTGFSSLAQLRSLPVNILKIDRRFVQELNADSGNQQVVRAIVGLAQGLDLSVVAEGVETGEDLEQVRSLACDVAQGFALARPASPQAVEALLRDRAGRDTPVVTG